jgi:mRNA-degrading endonuclease RelE of RelBE toxin-antitoxin system
LRVGDVRTIHAIDDAPRTIVVLRVARRGESTYRRVR